VRVLHAIHDFLPRHRAGSEVYVSALAREQSARHDPWVLCADYDPALPHRSLRWRTWQNVPVVELINNWVVGSFAESYRSAALDATLDRALRAIQPDVLHVHGLLGLSLELPRLARARGIPSVATLHDYTLVCPSGGQRFHASEEHVCRTIEPARCVRCFASSPFHARMGAARLTGRAGLRLASRVLGAARRLVPGPAAVVATAVSRTGAPRLDARQIEARLGVAREVFRTIELFVAPSHALADEFRRLGVPDTRLAVSALGFARLAVPRAPAPDGCLRIGYVGTIARHKGVHVLVDAVQRLPRGRFTLAIHGDPGVSPDYVAAVTTRARGFPVTLPGAFEPARAGEIYAGLDVLVVPSLWPENSPLVIREAFMAGVAVVAARVGGIPELIDDGRTGLLVEPGSTRALAGALSRLIDEPALLARFSAARPPIKSITDDALEWDERYRAVVAPSAGLAAT
jgi:glycosyltransferase involved in cell wall biosynthesis